MASALTLCRPGLVLSRRCGPALALSEASHDSFINFNAPLTLTNLTSSRYLSTPAFLTKLMSRYLSTPAFLTKLTSKLSKDPPPAVAVLHLAGRIADGRGSGPSAKRINYDSLNEQIDKSFELKNLKAVCLKINSPGGSPVQSELIAKRLVSFI